MLSDASAIVVYAYFGVFLLARFAHTFAYLSRRARMRRDAFTIAWLLNLIIGVHALVALAPT